jgi:hypothetical protein
MSGNPHLAVRVHTDRGSGEASHRDSGFMKRGHAGEHSGAERGGGGRRERAPRKHRRERSAFVGLDRDPDAISVGAPGEHRREGRVAVVGQPLNPRDRRRGLGWRHRDLVDHGRLAILEHGLPSRARPWGDELDQLRFRFALRH